jgi:hypothetical protein
VASLSASPGSLVLLLLKISMAQRRAKRHGISFLEKANHIQLDSHVSYSALEKVSKMENECYFLWSILDCSLFCDRTVDPLLYEEVQTYAAGLEDLSNESHSETFKGLLGLH